MAPILRTYSKRDPKCNRSGLQICKTSFKKKKTYQQKIHVIDVSTATSLCQFSDKSLKQVEDTFDRILKSENYKHVKYLQDKTFDTDLSKNDPSKSKSYISVENFLHSPVMTRSKYKAKAFFDSHCSKTCALKKLDEPVTNSLEIECDHKVNNMNFTSFNIGSMLESDDHVFLQNSNYMKKSFCINHAENYGTHLFHNISSAISSTPAVTAKKKIVDDTLSPIMIRSKDAIESRSLKEITNVQYCEKSPVTVSPYITLRRRKVLLSERTKNRYKRVISSNDSSINSTLGSDRSKSIFNTTNLCNSVPAQNVDSTYSESKSMFNTNEFIENIPKSSGIIENISNSDSVEKCFIEDNKKILKGNSIHELDVSKYLMDTRNSVENSSRVETYDQSNFQGEQINNLSKISLYVSPKMNTSVKVEISPVVRNQIFNSDSTKDDTAETKYKTFDAESTCENSSDPLHFKNMYDLSEEHIVDGTNFSAHALPRVNLSEEIIFAGSDSILHSSMTTCDNSTTFNENSRVVDNNCVSKLQREAVVNITNLNVCHQESCDDTTQDGSRMEDNNSNIFSEASVVVDNRIPKYQKDLVVNITKLNFSDVQKTSKIKHKEKDHGIPVLVVNSVRCGSAASENETNTFNESSHIADNNEVSKLQDDANVTNLRLLDMCKVANYNERDFIIVHKSTNLSDVENSTNTSSLIPIIDSSSESFKNNSGLSDSQNVTDECSKLDETRGSFTDLSQINNSKSTNFSICKVNQNIYNIQTESNKSEQTNNHISISDSICELDKSNENASTVPHIKEESIQNISSSSDSTCDFYGYPRGTDTSEAIEVVEALKDTIHCQENFLSGFERETTITSTPKLMGPPKLPGKRLPNKIMSTVKTGKSWRRSLFEVRKTQLGNDCTLNKGHVPERTCPTNFTRLNCESTALRRDSIRIVPVSATPQAGSVLENYAVTLCKSYISDALPEDLLEEYLENISLTRDTLSLTLRETNLVPAVTAKEIVLRRCGQTEPLPFKKCYPNTLLHNCQKIGEGVYGEVFLFRNLNRETTVMKIIPIEGDIMVNGERQKKFSEILSEIIIAMELSNLRKNETNSTSGFSDLGKISCVQGKYPSILLDRWELYEESRGSENDSPIVFMDDQLFIVMEFTNGGKDLETFVFNNAQQAYSVFVQVTCALAIAERQLEFEHRDLHWGNILIAGVDRNKTLSFVVDGKAVELDTNGVEATIIDFTLSRISYDGVCIYNDLSLEPDLFTSSGDYQFEIYRLMQEQNANKWQKFVPYTNVLWLHYMVDKTINALRYKYKSTKIHKCYVKKLTEVREKMLAFKCAGEILNFLLNL